MTTLLIDADTAAYIAALGAEKVIEWEETGMVTKHADTADAIASFEAYVKDMIPKYAAKTVKLALTGPTNFRKALYPAYKSKRGPKPMALAAVRKHAVENMGAVMKDGIEADDTIGIWATHPTLIPGPKIVVSIDKDLRSIPCRLTTGDGVLQTISVQNANYNFLKQVLTGDSVDGYPGLPGCGPKGAAKLLQAFVDDKAGFNAKLAWLAIVDAYVAKGLTEADALVQARCARILRFGDYDFKKKEPILWTPPSQ